MYVFCVRGDMHFKSNPLTTEEEHNTMAVITL